MKVLSLLFLLIIFFGCNGFELNKISSKDVVEEEIHQINWSKVDSYPTFDLCESLSEREKIKACFEETIALHFYEQLSTFNPLESNTNNDTITFSLKINDKGLVKLQKICGYNLLNKDTLEIWCTNAINSLPKIYPAQKRGVPVGVTFDLPIIIDSN